MNLDEFRRRRIEQQFVLLLGRRRFEVTQDQDYLNVIACGSSVLLGYEWNKTPIPDDLFEKRVPKLVHYKINWKPWHYENILYGDLFWKYALRCIYSQSLKKISRNYTTAERMCDQRAYNELYRLAERQTINAEETILMNA